MLTVLAVTVTSTSSIRTNLKTQYRAQLAQAAGDAGIAYAKACLAANNNVPTWTDAKPLTPGTDCSGDPLVYDAAVEVMVVAGGGSGGTASSGNGGAGGGGAGGLLYEESHDISVTTYPVTVGDGGSAPGTATTNGNNGENSVFDDLIAVGGGGGSAAGAGVSAGLAGGSGGGGGYKSYTLNEGGSGVPGQGNDGGSSLSNNNGGGGGGAGSSGGSTDSGGPSGVGGVGGSGVSNSISGSSVTYASGGDGSSPPGGYIAGAANTGDGGSGGTYGGTGGAGAGGSGVVIVSYSSSGAISATGGTVTQDSGMTIHTFTSDGNFVVSDAGVVACPDDPRCYVTTVGDVRSTFSVGEPSVDLEGNVTHIPSVGTVELLRSSTGVAWRTYESQVSAKIANSYEDDGNPVGTSISGYWDSPPLGYLEENGQSVPCEDYPDLYNVLYSGTCSGNFVLPDSRGRVAVNLNPSDTEFNTVGETYGAKTHQLTEGEMASHTHTQNAHDHDVRYKGFTSMSLSSSGAQLLRRTDGADTYQGTKKTYDETATNQNTGGNGSHNNIQPSITKKFAIKYTSGEVSKVALPAGTSLSGYWASEPAGYLMENGQSVLCDAYPDLYDVLYPSGTCSGSFDLPDSRGRVAVNLNPSDSEFNTIGEKYGAKTHQLTQGELPSHTHTQNAHDHTMRWKSYGGISASSSGWLVLRRTDGADSYNGTDGNAANARTATNQNTGGNQPHNNIQPSIVKTRVIKHSNASSATSNAATGNSISGYWSSPPLGYLPENGDSVLCDAYPDLYDVLYPSGTCSGSFDLPDSRGRVAVNLNPSDSEFNTIGEKYGAKTHQLTQGQMPSHTHTQNSHDHNVRYQGFSGTYGNNWYILRGDTSSYDGTDSNAAQATTATNQNTGGNQPHNNIQPSIVQNFAIKY